MNRFRRSQPTRPRTPEERERDRAEREQRRRARRWRRSQAAAVEDPELAAEPPPGLDAGVSGALDPPASGAAEAAEASGAAEAAEASGAAEAAEAWGASEGAASGAADGAAPPGWVPGPPRPVDALVGRGGPEAADAPTPLRPPSTPGQPGPEEPASPTGPVPSPDGPPQVVPLRRRDEPSAPLDPAARVAGRAGGTGLGWRHRVGRSRDASLPRSSRPAADQGQRGHLPWSVGGTGSSGGARGRVRRRTFAILAIVVALGLVWFLYSLFQPFKGDGHGQVAVTIPPGTGTSGVGNILARDHVVSSGFFFTVRAWLSGRRSDLHAGHFSLKRDMSYGAALDALTRRRAPVRVVKVTIPEGDARRQIANLAHADGLTGSYLVASSHSSTVTPSSYGAGRGTKSLEGFLFPATYDLAAGSPAQRLVNDQLAAFKHAFGQVNLGWARAHKLTPYDVLTVASMVEREAGVPRDRPLIAAVIYNRLRRRMPLGIDATIRYALHDWSRPLTASDLRIRSPYNTRLRRGLPPTPIGNPGLASLQAAAHPARVSYLYYVVKPGGHGEHLFASTFAQFQRDAARYRRARTRNGGRSPTR